MNSKKPDHRKQIQAPGRKPPQKIDKPRTLRVDPDIWEIAMAHAVRLSSQRGYIVTLKEALGDIVRSWNQGSDHASKDKKTPDRD